MTGNRVRSRREDYAEETRQALVEAGRDAFAREGFQAAVIENIARAARVTRGAFYYHFKDKTALFDAVVVDLQRQAAAAIEQRARTHALIWDRLQEGLEAFLDASADPIYGRIVVQEAEAILGGDRFREIEEAYPLALLVATLQALQSRGQIAVPDITLFARLVDAMICKLARLMLRSDDPRRQREDGLAMVRRFLDSVRT